MTSRSLIGVSVGLVFVVVASTALAMAGPDRIDSPTDRVELELAVRDPRPGDGRPTAIVSLGDSFISGDAGRWAGNSNSGSPDRGGTDRAARPPGPADPEIVYPGTVDNGCHRSDVAPILSTSIPVDAAFNIACSDARTEHIVDSTFKGEAPQSQQLQDIARDHDVKMVVLSIGGNDLGFADIVLACVTKFAATPGAEKDVCNDEEQPRIDARMPAAMTGVDASIDAIRASMAAAGSNPSDYRMVVVSYPSPIPRGPEIRYREAGSSRVDTGGCPFWNEDATWTRDSLVPQISDNLRIVANQNEAEFLDYRDAFQGKETCSMTTERPGDGGAPNPATSEWTRWFGIAQQGEYQEYLHPNFYGQQAYARCFDLLWSRRSGGEWTCTNTGAGPRNMILTAI